MNYDPDDFAELTALIEAMCEDSLSQEQAKRLEELIESDADAMEFYIEYVWMNNDVQRSSILYPSRIDLDQIEGLKPDESSLTETNTDTPQQSGDGMVTTTANQQVWKRDGLGSLAYGAMALVALLAVIGIAYLVLSDGHRPGPIAGNGVAGNEVVPETVDADSLQRKELADGTIVIARANTKYTVEGFRKLELSQGDLYLIVAKSESPFVVKTADGEVHATGTRFTVSSNRQTETAVAQGKVVLRSENGDVEVGAGQQGTFSKDQAPTRGPAKRLSYLVNWAKDALKQDEKLVPETDKENGLIAIDPYGQEARLTLRKYNVDIYIEDGVARTTIDQTFFNHNPWNTEGTFYFPLPPDASVSRLAMYVNGELNEGGMVTRERGQEIYTEILHQRRDPALLEMMEGNMFKMRIFPLEGRQEKRIFLSYSQNLKELYGTTNYWFPMDHTHDVANSLSINVRIKDGAKSFDPTSSTHEMSVSTEGDDLLLQFSEDRTKPDQDFLLNLVPKAANQNPETSVAVHQLNGLRYLSAKLRPQLEGQHKPQPRQWIVLNDVSASRSKIDVQTQAYILKRLITEADDDDSVMLIDLNTTARKVNTQPLKVRSKEAASLSSHEPERRIGATNMEAGFAAAAEAIKEHECDNPVLVYLGDGVATDGEKTLANLPRSIPSKCKFVGIGIGKKVDAMFMQVAANRTGGAFVTINPNEDIDWRVFDMLAMLNTPRLTNIQAELLDSEGQPMASIAYPSSRLLAAGETLSVTAMCAGELPAEVQFRGRIAGKPFETSVKVEGAKKGASYLPRLWAKRHIDELLKSSMSSKEEIIALSRDFYVVTPYTSLIVLEDDAMYEQYGVERGRKDHWAEYDAPQQIEVVREPIDWNRWGWGNFQGEESKVDVNTRPKTIQEIVDNIQLRVNAPFYIWPENDRGSRTSLYRLCDSDVDADNDPNGDASRLLTLWYLLAANDRAAISDWNQAVTSGNESQNRLSTTATKQYEIKLRQNLYRESMLALVPGQLSAGGFGGGMGGGFGGGGMGGGGGGLGGGRGFYVPSYLPELNGQLFGRSAMFRYAVNGRFRQDQEALFSYYRTPSFGNFGWMERNLVSGSGRLAMPQTNWSLALDGKLASAFDVALNKRQSRLSRDIRKFNRQHGYWGGNTWNRWDYSQGLDLRSGVWSDFGMDGLVDMLGTDLQELDGEMSDGLFFEDVDFAFEFVPLAKTRELRPFGSSFSVLPMDEARAFGLWRSNSFFLQQSRAPAVQLVDSGKDRIIPRSFLAVVQQPVTTQPGMASILAAEYLKPRLDSLESSKSDRRGKAEKQAIEMAISKMGQVGARVEPNDLFWGHAGWQFQPRPSTSQPPTVQAYQGYRWSFDLTRYANGLYSDAQDMLDEVISQYGSPKPRGSITDRAKKLIEESRQNLKHVIVKHDNQIEVFVGPNDQFEMHLPSNMYLNERIVCDGESIYQVYDELGLVAKRVASNHRMSAFRQLVPHLIEPADSMIQHFDVTLANENAESFTLKLTPAKYITKPNGNDAEKPETDDKGVVDSESKLKIDWHLQLQVDHEGRTIKRELVCGDESVFTISFTYSEGKVETQWQQQGKTKEESSRVEYAVKRLELNDDTFKARSESVVVIEMPLKKPAYYSQKIQELSGRTGAIDGTTTSIQFGANPASGNQTFLVEDLEQVINLHRHRQLASLQDFTTASWGYAHPQLANQFLNALIQMCKHQGEDIKKGDLVLFGSRGGTPRSINGIPKSLKSSELANFFDLRGDWGQSASKINATKGLIGHLTAYRIAALSSRKDYYDKFRSNFPNSPLALALLSNRQTDFRFKELVKLNDDPSWAGTALMVAAMYCSTADDKKLLSDAFWKWESKLGEQGMIPIVSPNLINHVKQVDRTRLEKSFGKHLDAIESSDDITTLLTFAEQLTTWGESKLADRAYIAAREKLGLNDTAQKKSLLKRFVYAQALWAGNRYRRALAEYKEILSQLDQKAVPQTAALLAAMARLAHQAGDVNLAIELEENAMALEQPYLPDAINLAAFRQRYQWLWSRYLERVQAIPSDDPDRADKIDVFMKRATATWDRWSDVDRDNPSLPGQMASLQHLAGKKELAWEYLSSVIDWKPKDAVSYSTVGQWFQRHGQKAVAVKWFGEAPQWDTANPQWIFQYGKALKDAGRRTEANVQFNKVVNGKWAPGLQRWIDQARAEIQ